MGVLSVIKAQFSKKIKFKKNDAESEPNASARVTANLLTRFSSSCRCGGISIPAERVGKMYRCIQCNKETINSGYNLQRSSLVTPSSSLCKPFINMDFYAAAVMLLKNDKRKRPTLKQIKYRLKN